MTAHKGKTNVEVVYPFSTREPKNEKRAKILFLRFSEQTKIDAVFSFFCSTININ